MAQTHEGAGFASSLTDLMTSLAVIFILLYVATLQTVQQESARTKSEVLSHLEKALELFRNQGVQVMTDPKDPLGLLVLVPEDLLNFQQGKSQIPPKGREFLVLFTPKLVETACSTELRGGISSIVVEGHASTEGIEEDNLRLSQQRSMEVVKESLSVLPKAAEGPSALHACFLDFVSATGRGSAEPVKDASGQEDRQRSRRVVFKIRVRSPEERQLNENLSSTMSGAGDNQ